MSFGLAELVNCGRLYLTTHPTLSVWIGYNIASYRHRVSLQEVRDEKKKGMHGVCSPFKRLARFSFLVFANGCASHSLVLVTFLTSALHPHESKHASNNVMTCIAGRPRHSYLGPLQSSVGKHRMGCYSRETDVMRYDGVHG